MQEPLFKTISAEDFVKLDLDEVTLVDIREPEEKGLPGLPGSIDVPFSQLGSKIDLVPKGKPVYVYCKVGELSDVVAEVLGDRGYEAYSVKGGYNTIWYYREGGV